MDTFNQILDATLGNGLESVCLCMLYSHKRRWVSCKFETSNTVYTVITPHNLNFLSLLIIKSFQNNLYEQILEIICIFFSLQEESFASHIKEINML